mgnify:CR=1 FL=1
MNKFISISHSFDYSGIVVSKSKVGLDIEKFRPKILDIFKIFRLYFNKYIPFSKSPK